MLCCYKSLCAPEVVIGLGEDISHAIVITPNFNIVIEANKVHLASDLKIIGLLQVTPKYQSEATQHADHNNPFFCHHIS